jgi:hypothetical protein
MRLAEVPNWSVVLIGSARGDGRLIGKYSAIRAGPAVSTAQCEARNTASWMLWVTKMMVLPLWR